MGGLDLEFLRFPSTSWSQTLPWGGSAKSDPTLVSVAAQGSSGFSKIGGGCQKEHRAKYSKQEVSGKEPLMIHVIIILSGKYCVEEGGSSPPSYTRV